jgi:hypothetical protein
LIVALQQPTRKPAIRSEVGLAVLSTTLAGSAHSATKVTAGGLRKYLTTGERSDAA